jgi:hypothetical protein
MKYNLSGEICIDGCTRNENLNIRGESWYFEIKRDQQGI